MPRLRSLDPTFPIELQLAVDVRPVVLMNVIALDKADEQAFLRTWHDDALFMKHDDFEPPCRRHKYMVRDARRVNLRDQPVKRRSSGSSERAEACSKPRPAQRQIRP